MRYEDVFDQTWSAVESPPVEDLKKMALLFVWKWN